jgi:hypothetical protein
MEVGHVQESGGSGEWGPLSDSQLALAHHHPHRQTREHSFSLFLLVN